MTCGVFTHSGIGMPESAPVSEDYVLGLPAQDETVCAADPFDDFDDDDFDDEFDDDFEEEWDDDLPGDADQFPDDDKEEDDGFSDDADFDE